MKYQGDSEGEIFITDKAPKIKIIIQGKVF